MKDTSFQQTEALSIEKACELGKTLTRGGITLADSQTAFKKRCGK